MFRSMNVLPVFLSETCHKACPVWVVRAQLPYSLSVTVERSEEATWQLQSVSELAADSAPIPGGVGGCDWVKGGWGRVGADGNMEGPHLCKSKITSKDARSSISGSLRLSMVME